MIARSLFPLMMIVASAGVHAQNSDSQTTTYHTPQGETVVHSGQPAAQDFGPPPAFATLAHGKGGYISSGDADAYPPLANDFIHADGNRDGRISKSEYERWAKAH